MLCMWLCLKKTLWRSGAERDEEVLCGGNIECVVLALIDADTVDGYRV
jgi:hypothetical protein